MKITSQHITGLAVGLGAAAFGFYAYKKNEAQVDEFLRRQGIPVPECGRREPTTLTLEELVAEKERLEDLIAERQHAAAAQAPAEAS